MKVTVGGSGRIHSGGKISQNLQDFNRSNHNLDKIVRLNMAPGVLYPFYNKRVKPGDTFDLEDIVVDIYSDPTLRAMYGSYKMYIEFYYCQMRLVQAWLHNNKEYIGEDMSQVKLPIYDVTANNIRFDTNEPLDEQQISPSSLVAFLGERSWGRSSVANSLTVRCIKNAEKHIHYYDIYKNYYANRQEKVGWIVDYAANSPEPITTSIWRFDDGDEAPNPIVTNDGVADCKPLSDYWTANAGREFRLWTMWGKNLQPVMSGDNVIFYTNPSGEKEAVNNSFTLGPGWLIDEIRSGPDNLITRVDITCINSPLGNGLMNRLTGDRYIVQMPYVEKTSDEGQPNIEQFPLTNIDDMREDILAAIKSKTAFTINANTYEPYGNQFKPSQKIIYKKDANGEYTLQDTVACTTSYYDMQGLALCTYQSDKFNNWLDSEYIEKYFGDGGRGIVDVTNGLNLDTLQLAMKIYNQTNKIAISNRSYNDWLLVIHGQHNSRANEVPIYEGGMSQPIYFQELRSTAASGDQPAGSIVANAVMGNDKKGGKVVIRPDEIGTIIGIARIVPKLIYSQGNNPDNDQFTADDIHQPDLDGIGYQDLLTERFAAVDTLRDADGNPTYRKIGKQPAWIDLMTDIDEAYGDFARENNKMTMTLNRRYQYDDEGNLIDGTTYIDPGKFNYIWAGIERKAQHFDVHIGMRWGARRRLSTRQMPGFNTNT